MKKKRKIIKKYVDSVREEVFQTTKIVLKFVLTYFRFALILWIVAIVLSFINGVIIADKTIIYTVSLIIIFLIILLIYKIIQYEYPDYDEPNIQEKKKGKIKKDWWQL